MQELLPKNIVKQGDTVGVNYIGWLDDGTVFDSSIDGWKEKGITKDSAFNQYSDSLKPLEFTLGQNKMIPGFEEAIPGMNISEERIIRISPEKAYPTGANHPLAGQYLNFKIRIESIT